MKYSGLRLVSRTLATNEVTGGKLVKPRYVWPCKGCGGIVDVSRETFAALKSSRIPGVKCPDCLGPPPKPASMRAA